MPQGMLRKSWRLNNSEVLKQVKEGLGWLRCGAASPGGKKGMGPALPNVWVNRMVTDVVLLVGLGEKDEEEQVNSPCHFLGASISISDFNVLLVSHLPIVSWEFAGQRR